MKFFKQLIIVLITAAVVFGIGAGFYWLFHAGERYLSAGYSNSPLSSPILWIVVVIAVVLAVISRIWRALQEKLFIKRYNQYKKQQNKQPK